MPILDHFGMIAPLYEKVIPVLDASVLFALLDLSQEHVVLDAGGGTGRIAQALCPYVQQVFVADLSLKMLDQAKKKACLDSACSHTEALPFKTGSFDRIVMVDALHHVCDQRQTAGEMYRLLKPGGRLVIQEPDVRRVTVKFIALGEKLMLMRSRFLSPNRMKALFEGIAAPARIYQKDFSAWVVVDKPVVT
jgi:demethylmenaquinone methyltransferase/2-methoxy-6-polyprenyl-1,4-benzoquinol methylase